MLGKHDAAEALTPDVLADVDEGDEAGVALGYIHPVACPGVVNDVSLAAQPDPDAVQGVVKDGQEDEGPLEDAHQRQAVEEANCIPVGDGALEGFEI